MRRAVQSIKAPSYFLYVKPWARGHKLVEEVHILNGTLNYNSKRNKFSCTNNVDSACSIDSDARFGPMARPAWLNARSNIADEPGMLKQ